MRSREEIERSGAGMVRGMMGDYHKLSDGEKLFLEVLLDIRDLLDKQQGS